MARYAVHICGGASGTGPKRENDCPNALHDWPTPSGYIDATEEAGWRLRHQWANVKCPDCGLYGWRPGKLTAKHQPREAANHGA